MDLFAIRHWPPKIGGIWQIRGRAEIKGIEAVLDGQLQIHYIKGEFRFDLDFKIKKGFVHFMSLKYSERYLHDGERLAAVECRLSPKIHVPLVPVKINEKVEVKTLHDCQFLKHIGEASSVDQVRSIDWSKADDCKPPMGLYFILPHIENLDFNYIGKFQFTREESKFALVREGMKIRFDNGNYWVSGDYDYGSAEIDFVKK